MSVVRSEYTDAYGTHPFDFYVDNDKWNLFNAASTLFSGIIRNVQSAQDAIASICGSAALTTPIPLVETGTNMDDVMAIVKAIFPNSYYIDAPSFDGNIHYESMTVGQPSNKFSLSAKGTYTEWSGVQKLSLAVGNFANSAANAEGGRYIGLGVALSANEHYDGEFNLYLSPALSSSIFDVENMTFASSLSGSYPNNVCVRWYTKRTNSTNFWIFGKQSRASGYLAGFQLEEREEPEPPGPSEDDPYGPNPGGPGYSEPGGGPAPTGGTGATGTGGLHDDTSDTIPTPSLPSSISTSSGLFTAYNPDVSQLADFARNLWNADVTLMGGDLFKLLFGGDAFNAIIGLHLIPVQPDTSGLPNIMLGNWDSGAPAPKIVNQYKQVPFGSLMLPEYWGNSIDYSPYTRIQLALPYIGIVDVDTDDVLGSNNTLTYNIDVLSGALCATLHCVKGNLSSVIYQWSGSCAVSLPVTGASFNAVMGAIMGIGAAVAGGIALASGPIGAAIGTAGVGIASTAMGVGAAGNMYGSVKGKVQKSGAFGANSGALGIMTPYFIVTRPVQSVPETWQADKGYPANISAQLGTLTGYTEVSEINLECSGTEAEKKEIIDLLKKGVLF